jgi:hypothetical protein
MLLLELKDRNTNITIFREKPLSNMMEALMARKP